MTIEEKLETVTRLASDLYDVIRLLSIRIDGAYLAAEQTLSLLELPVDDPVRVATIVTLKDLIKKSREEPTAQTLLDKPAADLKGLGVEVISHRPEV